MNGPMSTPLNFWGSDLEVQTPWGRGHHVSEYRDRLVFVLLEMNAFPKKWDTEVTWGTGGSWKFGEKLFFAVRKIYSSQVIQFVTQLDSLGGDQQPFQKTT